MSKKRKKKRKKKRARIELEEVIKLLIAAGTFMTGLASLIQALKG